ncbi:MAG: hypothetical protein RL354_260, partial [Planctomycetota bacterium]
MEAMDAGVERRASSATSLSPLDSCSSRAAQH